VTSQHGYQVASGELSAQGSALEAIGDQTTGLVASADRLAQRLPMLGTAPPAMHLAMRLREAAGGSGLTGEVGAADTEMNDFHRALRATVASYLEYETGLAETFRGAGT
jgi:hypothetical protein